MRKEVSKLTAELHQRDLTIAALNSSSSGVKQQLRGEVERAEQRAAELKVSTLTAGGFSRTLDAEILNSFQLKSQKAKMKRDKNKTKIK